MLVFLLNVAGAAALLIYAVRMVRTGVERAFSVQLRRWLRASAKNRIVAAASGGVVALMLQSATALAVMASGFIATGAVSAPVGLAMLFGADVGSALVVQALVLRPSWLAPLLLLAGVATFLRSQEKPGRQIGRILIGLALVFVALGMIAEASGPIREFPGLQGAALYLQRDPVSAFLLGALLAWVVHSSVAAILLVMTFAAEGILSVPVAAAVVLGANLGGSLIAVTLMLGAAAGARQMVWANAVLRGGGAAACLALLMLVPHDSSWLGSSAGQQVINLHLVFNLTVAILGLPLVGPLHRAVALVIRDPATGVSEERPSALDPAALDNPDRALACAAREVLHMGELAEAMLRPVMPLFTKWDAGTAAGLSDTEMRLDQMYSATKTYLAQLDVRDAGPGLTRRVTELLDQAALYESAGDSVTRLTLGLARKLNTEGLNFSARGYDDLSEFHDFVLTNAQAALHVQMSGNPAAARELVRQKERARQLERFYQHAHLDRLRDGNPETSATSNIHLGTLRELKQINTCFITVAYPILTESGDLLETRLKRVPV